MRVDWKTLACLLAIFVVLCIHPVDASMPQNFTIEPVGWMTQDGNTNDITQSDIAAMPFVAPNSSIVIKGNPDHPPGYETISADCYAQPSGYTYLTYDDLQWPQNTWGIGVYPWWGNYNIPNSMIAFWGGMETYDTSGIGSDYWNLSNPYEELGLFHQALIQSGQYHYTVHYLIIVGITIGIVSGGQFQLPKHRLTQHH